MENREQEYQYIFPPLRGACPKCGAYHPPEQPHNRESLYYQMRFRQRYGRFPTWEDAIAHCSDAVKAEWRGLFEANGISTGVNGDG